MTERKSLILALLAAATAASCGGGGGSEPPPPPVESTFTVSLSGVDVDRSADQLVLDTGGLPVEGATITITE